MVNGNGVFTFSLTSYLIRYGIFEILLLGLSYFSFFPISFIILILIFLKHISVCYRQTIILDPLSVVKKYTSEHGLPEYGVEYIEKIEKRFNIHNLTHIKIGYFSIKIYGDIDYKKKSSYYGDGKIKKVAYVRLYRGFKFENELISYLNKILLNGNSV